MKKLIILMWLCIFLNALPIYASDYYAIDAVAGIHIDQPSLHSGESAKYLYLYADGKCAYLSLIKYYDHQYWTYSKWPDYPQWRYMIITIQKDSAYFQSGTCYWSFVSDYGTVNVYQWVPQYWLKVGSNNGNDHLYSFGVSPGDFNASNKMYILAECDPCGFADSISCDVAYVHTSTSFVDSLSVLPESLGKVKSIFR